MRIKTALATFVTVMSIGGIQVSGNTETLKHEPIIGTYGWRNQYHDRAYYDVQQGDTLSGISFEYGVSVSELARVNHIEDINYIQVGQRLTFKGVNYEKAWSSFNRAFVLFSPFMVLLAGVMLFQPLWVIMLYMVAVEVGYLVISMSLWLAFNAISKYWR